MKLSTFFKNAKAHIDKIRKHASYKGLVYMPLSDLGKNIGINPDAIFTSQEMNHPEGRELYISFNQKKDNPHGYESTYTEDDSEKGHQICAQVYFEDGKTKMILEFTRETLQGDPLVSAALIGELEKDNFIIRQTVLNNKIEIATQERANITLSLIAQGIKMGAQVENLNIKYGLQRHMFEQIL